MILENEGLEDIARIWEENNQGYVGYECNQRSLNDKDMLKIVYKENHLILGYIVLYFGKDFCDLEGYPNKLEDIPLNTIYIWEVVTDRNYMNKGVASKLYSYIFLKYGGYTIYSAINLENIASIKLHEKMEFDKLYQFQVDGENYVMMDKKLK